MIIKLAAQGSEIIKRRKLCVTDVIWETAGLKYLGTSDVNDGEPGNREER